MPEINFGGHLERIKEEGVKVHYNQLARKGDSVEAISDVNIEVNKGARLVIKDIIVEPKGNERGFSKSLVFKGIEGEFNPKKFKKV